LDLLYLICSHGLLGSCLVFHIMIWVLVSVYTVLSLVCKHDLDICSPQNQEVDTRRPLLWCIHLKKNTFYIHLI